MKALAGDKNLAKTRICIFYSKNVKTPIQSEWGMVGGFFRYYYYIYQDWYEPKIATVISLCLAILQVTPHSTIVLSSNQN